MMIGFVVFIALIQKYYEDEVHFDLANQQFKIIGIMNVSFQGKRFSLQNYGLFKRLPYSTQIWRLLVI